MNIIERVKSLWAINNQIDGGKVMTHNRKIVFIALMLGMGMAMADDVAYPVYVEQPNSWAENQKASAEAALASAKAGYILAETQARYNERHKPAPYVLPEAPRYTGGPL